jgi:alpha-L-fucosidase 2
MSGGPLKQDCLLRSGLPIQSLLPCVILCLFTLSAIGGNSLRLWHTHAASKWDEANPIGNGRLGAMVYGGIDQEHLQLNENTLYSGYPGHRDVSLKMMDSFGAMTNLIARRKFAEAEQLATEKWLGAAQACYQPLGDLFLDFDHPVTASNYVRELDLSTAVCRVRYQANGVQFTREIFASHPDDAIVLHLTADKPGSLSFHARLGSPHPANHFRKSDSQLAMRGQLPGFVLRRDLPTVEKKKDTWKYPLIWDEHGQRRTNASQIVYDGRGMFFDVRLDVRALGGTVSMETNTLAVAGADEVVCLLSAASSYNGYDKDPVTEGADSASNAERCLDNARRRSGAELLDRHVRDYKALFDRVSLDLGDSQDAGLRPTEERIRSFADGQDPTFASIYFQFGRYLMISGSRPGSQPLNLQGHLESPHHSALGGRLHGEHQHRNELLAR